MSDMEHTEGAEGSEAPAPRRRVIGTPPSSPPLLGRGDGPGPGGAGKASDTAHAGEHFEGKMPAEPENPEHAKRAEKVVAASFTLAFLAGCGFIAAYVGLGVHTVDKTLRSNLGLGVSLSVALLALGFGALVWVRHLMPNVETVEERHLPLRP